MRPPIHLAPILLPGVLACVLRGSPASGQAVGPEFQVNSYTTDTQGSPRVATDSGGNFVVVWRSNTQDGSDYGVFGQRYTSGGLRLGMEFRVNTFTTSFQGFPSVAFDSGGDFVVVWQGDAEDGSANGVFGQRYDSTGAPLGTEFQVNTYTTNGQDFPSVAFDSGGTFVIVWQSFAQDGSGYGVFGQRFGSMGAPLGTEFRVNAYTTHNQFSPCVASDSSGNFVVVWESYAQDGSHYGIFGQRYGSAGAPLGAEFRVSSFTTGYQRSPSMASDSSGNFVVVWHSYPQDGSSFGVFGQRYGSTGMPLGAEFRVNTFTANSQRAPSVASDSDGNFAVAWQSNIQDGSSYGIFGQRYGSTGAPLGAEFRVNSYTTYPQVSASVASGSGGAFVVVWRGDVQDGSSNGVFGQRFCPALSSVAISVSGTTTLCTTSTGGTATVSDAGGGIRTHQWGYRTTTGGATSSIPGQTGTSYLINGPNFPPAGGFFYLVCATFPDCGTATFSNEVLIVVNPDMTAPIVAPPSALTTTQTLCM